ncbi:MAG TPA: hypothetical protein VGE47_08375 [Burkholderiaceae bacterium]
MKTHRSNSAYYLRLGAALLGLGSMLLPQAQASQLVPQNLKQMIQAADIIVSGDVTKVSDGIDRGVPFTEITLKVKGSIKRDLAKDSSYKFRQYGLLKNRKLGNGQYLLASRIEGMPSWTVGEKVTAFINKPSAKTGLTSTVGLAQGKLTGSGSTVANSFDNRGLFKGMSVDANVLSPMEAAMLAKNSGGIEGGVLTNLVKRAVKERWIEKGVMR